MGWAPSFNPLLIIGDALPGIALYAFYFYALHRLLVRNGFRLQYLFAAVVLDFVIQGGPLIPYWPVFGHSTFPLGLLRPPVPLSALGAVMLLAFGQRNRTSTPVDSGRNPPTPDVT